MTDYVAGALIGAGAVLAGALSTGWQRARARKHDAVHAREHELKTAMREYLAALDALALELSDAPATPKPNRADDLVDRAFTRLGLAVYMFIAVRLMRRAAYGQRHQQLIDRLLAASAHLRLIAPPGILDVMSQVQALADDADTADGAWSRRWNEMREDVRDRFRAELQDA